MAHRTGIKRGTPVIIPLGGGFRAQRLSRLAAVCGPSIYPAWRRFPGQCLSRLAAVCEPSIYPAWRWPTGLVFIPLGGSPRAQCLSRLAAAHGPSVYPAWRRFAGPVFIPLGGGLRVQYLSRLAAVCGFSVYPAWRRFAGPVFIPLAEVRFALIGWHPDLNRGQKNPFPQVGKGADGEATSCAVHGDALTGLALNSRVEVVIPPAGGMTAVFARNSCARLLSNRVGRTR